MALQTVNIGSAPNDGTGDPARTAFTKVNDNFAELYGIFGSEVEAATFTTKQDDLAVADYTRILRWSGAGSTGITGIAAPSTARVLTIVNASTDYLLWLENQNTVSSAANRFALPDGFPAFLMPGDTITVWYDLTSAVWRVLDWPSRGKAMGLTECEDFIAAGLGVYNSSTNSGSVGGGYTGSAAVPGLAGVSTSTSASSRPTIGGSISVAKGGGALITVSRIRCTTALPDGTETFTGIVGFSDVGSATHQNAIAWGLRWNGSAAEWAQECIAAGVATRSTTGSPAAVNSAYIWLGVFINAAGSRADFFYSTDGIAFVLANSATSGFPTSTFSPVAVAAYKTAGTTARVMNADIAGYRAAYSTARA